MSFVLFRRWICMCISKSLPMCESSVNYVGVQEWEGFSRSNSTPPPPPRLGFRVSFDFWMKKKLQQHKFGLTKALHLPPGDGWIWFGLIRCQLLGSSHRRGLCNNCCHGNNFISSWIVLHFFLLAFVMGSLFHTAFATRIQMSHVCLGMGMFVYACLYPSRWLDSWAAERVQFDVMYVCMH